MKVPTSVFKMLQKRSQLQLNIPAHCEILSADVERVTGEHIGINTLKRFLGFYEDTTTPRLSTLNIIARYLGATDWGTLMDSLSRESSQFKLLEGEILTQDLKEGCLLELTYLPDRKLLLECLGHSMFRVIMALNSKLQEDDVVSIQYIIPSFPLIASDVVRHGESLGRYTAAVQTGIKTIKQLF